MCACDRKKRKKRSNGREELEGEGAVSTADGCNVHSRQHRVRVTPRCVDLEGHRTAQQTEKEEEGKVR